MISLLRALRLLPRRQWCVYRYRVSIRCDVPLPVPVSYPGAEAPTHRATIDFDWHSPVNCPDDLPAHILAKQGVLPGSFVCRPQFRFTIPAMFANNLASDQGRIAVFPDGVSPCGDLVGVAYTEAAAMAWIARGETAQLKPLESIDG